MKIISKCSLFAGLLLLNSIGLPGLALADLPMRGPSEQDIAHAEFCQDLLDICFMNIIPGDQNIYEQVVQCYNDQMSCLSLDIEFYEVNPAEEPPPPEEPPAEPLPPVEPLPPAQPSPPAISTATPSATQPTFSASPTPTPVQPYWSQGMSMPMPTITPLLNH